jgi:hypothetical protein
MTAEPDNAPRYDTANLQNVKLVSRKGLDDLVVIGAQTMVMSKAEALVHAAWLVALADDNDEFDGVLGAVRSA